MKKSHLWGALSVCVFMFVFSSAHAAIVTTPSGLNPGDQYRLAFVTSTTTQALSPNIATYNTFVTGVANSVTALSALGTTWGAIASTAAIDARTNTGTNPASTGVPIYRLDGTKIANNNVDLWNGSIASPLNVTELGTLSATILWTGTTSAGTGVSSPPFVVLGAGVPGTTFPGTGDTTVTGSTWIQNSGAFPSSLLPLYAMSGTLTVAAVPIPPAVWLFGSGLIGLAGVARRRKQIQ